MLPRLIEIIFVCFAIMMLVKLFIAIVNNHYKFKKLQLEHDKLVNDLILSAFQSRQQQYVNGVIAIAKSKKVDVNKIEQLQLHHDELVIEESESKYDQKI